MAMHFYGKDRNLGYRAFPSRAGGRFTKESFTVSTAVKLFAYTTRLCPILPLLTKGTRLGKPNAGMDMIGS
jgi:hypothetical protein